jgi:hypothetical protein
MMVAARGTFFFKSEYEKSREGVMKMDRELLAHQEDEWRQKCESDKGVSSGRCDVSQLTQPHGISRTSWPMRLGSKISDRRGKKSFAH